MSESAQELSRVIGANSMLSPHASFKSAEWEILLSLGTRRLRRLRGAGYLTSYGERPDVVADWIIDKVAGVETVCDAVEWYLRTAEQAIKDARHERWCRQFRNRNDRARAAGFGSYHYLRLYRAELGEDAIA